MQQDDRHATLDDLNRALPLRKIDAVIDRLDISADAKALLRDLGRVSVNIGGQVLHLGRKILTLVIEICKRFPNTVFGVVATVAVGLVLGAMGPFAAMLAPVLTPLMLVFAVTKGMMSDFANATWAGTLREMEQKIAAMTGHATA